MDLPITAGSHKVDITMKSQSEWENEVIAKTREEYDKMSKEELVQYSRQYGEKIQTALKSDKNHRYPCGWCGKTPDETRIYVSPPSLITGAKDSRYLCYRCVTEEDQLKGWTELTETSYWLPIRPPALPRFNADDPDLTVEAHPTPLEMKKAIFSNPRPPGRLDTRGMECQMGMDPEERAAKKIRK